MGRSDAEPISNSNGIIVSPIVAGDYFQYGATEVYANNNAYYTEMYDPLPTTRDIAFQVNDSWNVPTGAQFQELVKASNTTTVWQADWTSIGSTKGGRLITSKVNGISLFFAAAGRYYIGTLSNAGDDGYYWSSTPLDHYNACILYFNSGNITTGSSYRIYGYSVRPVKN